MKSIKLPKDYRLGKAIESLPEWNPDINPRKWIKYVEEWEDWEIHDPTPVVGEVCIGTPNCALCIYHDPEYGLLPSVKFGKALRKYARCENCGAPPTTDFGLCHCRTSEYLVSYEVWETELKSLYYKELVRVKSKRRYLRKQLTKLKGKTPYTSSDIEKPGLIQNDTCYYCGVSINESFHIDHLTSLANEGDDDIYNIMLACPPCNQDKGVNNEVAYWRQLQKQLPLQEFRRRRESAKVMKKDKRYRFSSGKL